MKFFVIAGEASGDMHGANLVKSILTLNPSATFEGFGDNSLNLVLRAFLPSLENRLQVIHEQHTAIDQSFRKANLEIAFPQRDLHIRTMANATELGRQASPGDSELPDELRGAA